MSLYAQYLKEHRGDGLVENPEVGFASYRFLDGGKSIYIVDIYVVPEHRKNNFAKDLADWVCTIGKKAGAKELIGTVVPSANNSTQSLKVLLAYGMTLVSSDKDLIVFKKEL